MEKYIKRKHHFYAIIVLASVSFLITLQWIREIHEIKKKG